MVDPLSSAEEKKTHLVSFKLSLFPQFREEHVVTKRTLSNEVFRSITKYSNTFLLNYKHVSPKVTAPTLCLTGKTTLCDTKYHCSYPQWTLIPSQINICIYILQCKTTSMLCSLMSLGPQRVIGTQFFFDQKRMTC